MGTPESTDGTGPTETHKRQLNADLLAFIRA